MNAEQTSTAELCLKAAHDGSLSFPEIVGRLIAVGFEGYEVNYRRNCQSYYLPDGGSVLLEMPGSSGPVAAEFDSAELGRLIRWAQSKAADYSYASFSSKARAAGCAGYLVSFLGQRVLYFGRSAETHTEHFPS